ncbi:putative structural constituent of ribosome [Naematelia encephala]|uniref:Protein phosphatase methylesterase 1 n=1 Tax=Naematelia encephala TaxID=71784 RepID=A0A1Y2B0Q9_9TREE|nr:putative structural constituent of ribosome [Naematelia encephala]
MSEHFRKAVLSRLPDLPPTRAPWADAPDEDEDTEELEDDQLGELGGASFATSKRAADDLSPISASQFFTQALEVTPPSSDTTFRVYLTPPVIPATSSSSSSSSSIASGTPLGQSQNRHGTVLVCHHGAGAGGLSFAALAKEIKEKSQGELGVVAWDGRGHGKTRTEGPKEKDTDLSLPTLLNDFMGVLQHLFPDPKESPSLVLLGHSMGAAPILSASPLLQQAGYTVAGVGVLDVVEGTAVEALPLMKSILGQRPQSFRSVIDGIHWHITSNSIRNPLSARVSVPSYLVPEQDQTDPGPSGKQIWRTDLLATEPYWEEWYRGLSSRFLTAKCARLLVLAGQERLDKELMVGQMQGKFQLEVMTDVGHYLHEDDPAKLASVIVTFWRRNTRVVLPPKIGSTGSSGIAVRRVGEE